MVAIALGGGSTFSSSWLLPASAQPLKVLPGQDLIEHAFPMPQQAGVGTITRMVLPGGLTLSRAHSLLYRLEPGRVLRAAPVDIEFGEDTLFIQHLRRGANSLYEAVSGKTIEYRRGQLHMRVQRRLELVNGFHCDEQIDLYTVSVPLPYLVGLLGSESAGKVLQSLGLMDPAGACVVNVGHDLVWPLYRAFDTALKGDLLRMHLMANGMEFLNLLCQRAMQTQIPDQSMRGDCVPTREPAPDARLDVTTEAAVDNTASIDCLEAVRRGVIGESWSETQLQGIAARHKVSLRALRKAFLAHYGLSMSAYRTRHRLHLARQLLRESALPIKAIALDAGYSNVSNFNHAYKQEFGESPGSTRQSRLSACDDTDRCKF